MVNVVLVYNFLIVEFGAIYALRSHLVKARMVTMCICFYLQCTHYLLDANWCNNSTFWAVDRTVITSEVFGMWKEMEKMGTFLTFLLLLRTDDLWKGGFTSFKSISSQ